MDDELTQLTIEDLVDQSGIPVRTIRYYIAEGLLAGPGSRGRAAFYGEEHLQRLKLIRRLTEQRVPLKEIRERLATLTIDEIRTVLTEDVRREESVQVTDQTLSPQAYVASLLERARLARSQPGLFDPVSRSSARQEATSDATSGAGPERWARWLLAPGVELHVRADVLARDRGLVDRLLAAQ